MMKIAQKKEPPRSSFPGHSGEQIPKIWLNYKYDLKFEIMFLLGTTYSFIYFFFQTKITKVNFHHEITNFNVQKI